MSRPEKQIENSFKAIEKNLPQSYKDRNPYQPDPAGRSPARKANHDIWKQMVLQLAEECVADGGDPADKISEHLAAYKNAKNQLEASARRNVV